jgi:hypothetical protein
LADSQRKHAFFSENPTFNVGTLIAKAETGGAVMKSISIKSGITRSILMVGGLFVGMWILIAFLEEVALLLAYYLV